MDLLDPRGVDAAVRNQFGEGDPGGLTAHRVETGQQDALRGVIDQHVHAGDLLEGPDVAALPADNPALHLVTGQRHGRDHGLGGLLRGDALDAGHDDRSRFRFSVLLGLGFDLPGQLCGVQPGVLLHVGHEFDPGVLRRQAGNRGQRLRLLSLRLIEQGFAPVESCSDGVEMGLAIVQLGEVPVQAVLALSEQFLPAVGRLTP